MPYSVVCPSCKERNIGSAIQCTKCQTSLDGIPREYHPFSWYGAALQKATPSEVNKYTQIESIPQALWRAFRDSLIIFLLALLLTAAVCQVLEKRTLYDFGSALFYTTASLAVIGWGVFRGRQRSVIGFSAMLCFGLFWLIVSLTN